MKTTTFLGVLLVVSACARSYESAAGRPEENMSPSSSSGDRLSLLIPTRRGGALEIALRHDGTVSTRVENEAARHFTLNDEQAKEAAGMWGVADDVIAGVEPGSYRLSGHKECSVRIVRKGKTGTFELTHSERDAEAPGNLRKVLWYLTGLIKW